MIKYKFNRTQLLINNVLPLLFFRKSLLNSVTCKSSSFRNEEDGVDSSQDADCSEDVEDGAETDGLEERVEDEEDDGVAEPGPLHHQHGHEAFNLRMQRTRKSSKEL